ncbi:MAG: hypothetical protein H7837_05760 [Magnetococcus sp. MYC-9]
MKDTHEEHAAPTLTPDAIHKLERLKRELTVLQSAIGDLQGKSTYEVEGRIRQFQDKESEIKQFLSELGML